MWHFKLLLPLICLRKQLLDRLPAFFAFPFPIAGGNSYDFALGVYEKIYRDSTHTKLKGKVRFGIQQIQESQVMGFDITLHQFSNFFIASPVNRDGQNDQAFASVILMDLFQRGPLFEAVRSPGGPEIQHDELSLKFTQASISAR